MPTIVVTGKHATAEGIHGFQKASIRKVGQIEQNTKLIHLAQQLPALEAQSKFVDVPPA